MARKKTKAEQLAETPIEQLTKLGGEEGRAQLIKYAKTLRTGYRRRVAQFQRKGLVSHAQLTLEKSLPKERRAMKLNKLSRNQLILEIRRYQKFFRSKTSSVEGIKEVNKEQDLRIFGESFKSGKPISSLNQDQRITYWDYYDEFVNRYPNYIARYGSERVQEVLADAIEGSALGSDRAAGILEALDKARAIFRFQDLIEQEYSSSRSSANVYTGKGPFK